MVVLVALICGAVYRVILSALGDTPPTGTRAGRSRRRGSRTVRSATYAARRTERTVSRGQYTLAGAQARVARTQRKRPTYW